jgi:hypothetical protein
MKIRPVAVELFHADGQMDGRDVANSRFFANFENPRFHETRNRSRASRGNLLHRFSRKSVKNVESTSTNSYTP